jgi:quinol monooxygenase YgiN
MNNNLSVAILAKLETKPGKESEVEAFLRSVAALANEETTTPVWFALKLGDSTYGIFDAFADEVGRSAHLSGPIAKALMARWSELLVEAPKIETFAVLASKITNQT